MNSGVKRNITRTPSRSISTPTTQDRPLASKAGGDEPGRQGKHQEHSRDVGQHPRGLGHSLIGSHLPGGNLSGVQHLPAVGCPESLDGIVAHEPGEDGQKDEQRTFLRGTDHLTHVAQGLEQGVEKAGSGVRLPPLAAVIFPGFTDDQGVV